MAKPLVGFAGTQRGNKPHIYPHNAPPRTHWQGGREREADTPKPAADPCSMSESVKHQAEPQLRVYRRRKGEAKGFTWSDYRDLIYANADITKAEQAAEIIAFADYRQPGLAGLPRRHRHPAHRR